MAGMAVLLGFAAVGARTLARRPVLDLLQGEGDRQTRQGNRPGRRIVNQTQEEWRQRAKGKGKANEQALGQDAHPSLMPQDAPLFIQDTWAILSVYLPPHQANPTKVPAVYGFGPVFPLGPGVDELDD